MNRGRLDGGDAIVLLAVLWLGLGMLLTHMRETRRPVDSTPILLRGD